MEFKKIFEMKAINLKFKLTVAVRLLSTRPCVRGGEGNLLNIPEPTLNNCILKKNIKKCQGLELEKWG